MKRMSTAALFLNLLAACSSNNEAWRSELKKHPEIIFDVIEENPERFMTVVNKAAQKAQKAEYEKRLAAMKSEQENELKNPKQPRLENERRLTGLPSAKITVVEYADFQCPACALVHRSIREFEKKHPQEIQFYFKNMPLDFHKMAYPSALYFEAIRLQDKSKARKFYDFVFDNQQQLVNEDFLKKAAKHVGADLKRLQSDIQSDAVKKIIAEDIQEFEAFGFNGTPVILINGVSLHGAHPVDEFERMAELTKR